MPEFERISYTLHALEQMQGRRISEDDVLLALRHGDASFDFVDQQWLIELGHIRVVVVEYDDEARIVTVIRLRGRNR